MARIPTVADIDNDGNVLIGYVIESLFIDKGLDRRDYPLKGGSETLIWLDKDNTRLEISNPTDITAKEIAAKRAELKTAYDVQAYSRNRVADYPNTGDQMDMIYKDNKNSTTTHADAVEAVKTKWPKDNSGPV